MNRSKDTVEVFYDDLNPEAQAELLKFYHVSKPQQMNWDVFPIFILTIEG